MLRLLRRVLVVGLSGAAAQAAIAQNPVITLTPHVDLNAVIESPGTPTFARTTLAQRVHSVPSPAVDAPLFDDPPPEEGGWKGLARVLDALAPNVDTSLPLTSSQITDRIRNMLDQGRNEEALDVIVRRQAQLEAENTIGTDVQLMFLHGRALAALGRENEAIAAYLNMTTLYPELPEPWNNLASLYVRQGKLHMALDALNMALAAHPGFALARANLGEVQLMLARESFEQAAQQGVTDAQSLADRTTQLLSQ